MITSGPTPTVAASRPTSPPVSLTTLLWTRGLRGDRDLGPTVVEGRLPDDLRGTLYRNGPGAFGSFGRKYAHPFEGDGALTTVRFDGSGPRAGSRLTETAGLVEERAAGRALYGTAVPWARKLSNALRGKGKNTANTSVVAWQGRLFALMEAARPTEIDPVSLRTIGETDLDGVVHGWFSAHPHRVASRRTTYNFGVEYGRKNKLHLYALPDVGPARALATLELDGGPMLHDFIATDTHLVFFVSPTRVNPLRALTGIGDFTQLFGWRPELGTEVIVVPIDDPTAPVRFKTDAFYQWHFANAWSRADEVIVDYVHYPDFGSFHELGHLEDTHQPALSQARYHRAVIDLRARRLRTAPLSDAICEFPKVHPRVEGAAHQVAWLALGDLAGIGRLDVATGAITAHRVPAHQRVSEPIFVPRAGATDESDGHVLSLCYDGARDESFVAIYDGRDLAAGPTARVWLGYAVPITFHGIWVPA